MFEGEVVTRLKNSIVDYDDILQAVHDFQAAKLGHALIEWVDKAEQRKKIQEKIEGEFKYVSVADATLLYDLSAEEREDLASWVQRVRENIKFGIEGGQCLTKVSLKRLFQIPPKGPYLMKSTVHITELWHSLVKNPLDVQFNGLSDALSEDSFYRIDPETQEIICQGAKPIRLTKICHKLFDCLEGNYPSFVSMDEIVSKVWSKQPKSQNNSIRTTVKKIRDAFSNINVIEGEYGKGYRLRIQRQK